MCAERSTIELPEPPPVVDPPLEANQRQDEPPPARNVGIWVVAGLLLLCAILGTLLTRSHKPTTNGQATATVERTRFVRILRLKGTTEAIRSSTIAAPILASSTLTTLVITRLVAGGSVVKRGDVVVEFDRQTEIKSALDKQADYQKFASQAAESQATEDAARAKDETDLIQAEDELQKDQLEMRRNEILSRIDAEKNQEKLDEAKANLVQLRQTFQLKRQSAKAAIRILEIQRDAAHEDMLHAQGNAEKMQIRSPIDGVVVLQTIWKQGTIGEVKEGDQVHPGISLLNVVDPSAMQVRVQANQQDIGELKVGQPAQTRLDAYPEIAYASKLEQIAPLGTPGDFSDKLRSFTVLFSVQGSSAKLMPDLSAAVDVQLENRDNVLLVPRESVIADGSEKYVWVKSSLGFHKQEVSTGIQNDTQVVIQSGLSAGDILERNPAAEPAESE